MVILVLFNLKDVWRGRPVESFKLYEPSAIKLYNSLGEEILKLTIPELLA